MKRYPDMLRREGTLDDFIIQESSCYEPLAIRPGDTVLDVGANIGAFTRLAFEAGANRIVAVEPDPENCSMWKRNLERLDWRTTGAYIALITAAAVNDGGPELKLPLYLNTGKNKGIHSLVSHRGRDWIEVATVNWAKLLLDAQPDVVKIDIEGGEYALDLSDLPKSVRALAIEFHLTKKEWRPRPPAIIEQLKRQNFVPTVEKPDASGKRWTSFYVFHREI